MGRVIFTKGVRIMGWYSGELKGIIILKKEISKATLRKVGYQSFVDLAKKGHTYKVRQRKFIHKENLQLNGDSETYF
jgi:hypothetical protein